MDALIQLKVNLKNFPFEHYQAYKVEEVEAKQILQDFNELAKTICDKYCKMPEEWSGEGDLADSEACRNCILRRLGG